MSSMVSGFTPKTFEKRRRNFFPQRSGRRTRRNVWSFAPTAGDPKAKARPGCATAFPTGYGPCADAAQEATHFVFPSPSSPANAAEPTTAERATMQRNCRRANDALLLECMTVPPSAVGGAGLTPWLCRRSRNGESTLQTLQVFHPG